MHNGHTGDSPYYRKKQTDMAAYIQRHPCIIPPPVMEQLFQEISCHTFKHCYKQNRPQIKRYDLIFVRQQYTDDHSNTDPIDRTDRSVQKPRFTNFLSFTAAKATSVHQPRKPYTKKYNNNSYILIPTSIPDTFSLIHSL